MSDPPINGEQNIFDKTQRELQQIDLYRDTPIRYLGYANEVGEAFRSMLPVTAVRATYVIALGYASADALDKSRKEHKKDWKSAEERRKQVAIAAADTFLWQALASVAIPGFTINRICHFTGKILKRSTRWPLSIQKWATTFIGLGVIPFIVHPIDSAVEIGMDRTIRIVAYFYLYPENMDMVVQDKPLFALHERPEAGHGLATREAEEDIREKGYNVQGASNAIVDDPKLFKFSGCNFSKPRADVLKTLQFILREIPKHPILETLDRFGLTFEACGRASALLLDKNEKMLAYIDSHAHQGIDQSTTGASVAIISTTQCKRLRDYMFDEIFGDWDKKEPFQVSLFIKGGVPTVEEDDFLKEQEDQEEDE